MKHLLIIILSILLLSSPVIGDEPVVLYQFETSTGLVWKTFGDGKVQPKYTGEIKNGKMDGLGVLIYPYDDKSILGEWKNGKEWNTKHNKKDGTLIGKFENGEKIWGVLYRGSRNGKLGWYEEEWDEVENNKNIDYGKYVGGIQDGKRHGIGTLTSPDGDKYVGEFRNGKKHGYGTHTFSNGDKYVGEYKDGELNGQGTLTSPDGDKYVGKFRNGKKHGQGTFSLSGSKIYEGKWKNGKFNGQGAFTFSDGNKGVGEFRDNKPWNITTYDKDGNYKWKYLKGVRR